MTESGVDWLEWVRCQGIVLESARGPVPNLAEQVAGETIRGSWWSHPAGRDIYAAIQRVRGSGAVIATRLVNGRVTLIHRRLWPALVRLSERLPDAGLTALYDEHTPSGAHRTIETPYPAWVPGDVETEAKRLTVRAALEQLPASIRLMAQT